MALDSKYVLSQFAAIDTTGWKNPVRCATANTDVLPAYTRVGNVITADANGALPTIDGITLDPDDSVLLTSIVTAAGEDAGLYVVTQVGDGGSPFILTRRGDADSSAQVVSGMRVSIEEGTSFSPGTQFVLTTPNPITLNTDSLTFTPDPLIDRFDLLWETTDTFGDWTGGQTIHSGAFPPEIGRIYQWSGTLGATAQLPDIGPYDHNRYIGFAEGSGSSTATLTLTADASDYIFDAAGVPGAGNSIVIQGAWRFLVLQADLGAGGWKIVSDRYRISSLPNVTPVGTDVLVIEDASDAFRKKRVLVSDLSGGDADAVHVNVANEINGITDKAAPEPDDVLIIEDFSDTYNKKKVSAFNLLIKTQLSGSYFEHNLRANGDITSYGATGAQNDVDLGQSTWLVAFTNAASLDITGINAPSGDTSVYEKMLVNRSGFTVSLAHESGSSLANNRIVTPDGNTLFLLDGACAHLFYEPTFNRWRVITDPSSIRRSALSAGSMLVANTANIPLALAVGTNSVGMRRAANFESVAYAVQSLLLRGAGDVVVQAVAAGEIVGRPIGGNLGVVTGVQLRSIIYPAQTIFDASANTTDATPTTIGSFTTTTNNTTARFKFQVHALETATGDAALFDVSALTYRNAGGVISVKDTTFVNGPFRDQAAWNVTLSPSGSTVNIQVTGEVAKTIKWQIFGNAQEA